MKNAIVLLTIFSIVVLGSCKSAQQKESAAKDNIVAANQDLKEVKKENAEDWAKFKADSRIKIIENEERITELKAKMNEPGKTFDGIYSNRIEKLEIKNKELKAKLNAYDGNQSGWKNFKTEFNRDMDEIGNNIKDLFR